MRFLLGWRRPPRRTLRYWQRRQHSGTAWLESSAATWLASGVPEEILMDEIIDNDINAMA